MALTLCHNLFFSGEPSSKNRNFLFSFQDPIWTKDTHRTAFFRRTTTCIKLYIFTKTDRPLDWKKKVPAHSPTKIYCLDFKALLAPPPPPSAYFFICNTSQLLCSGMKEYMYSLLNAEDYLVSVFMYVCMYVHMYVCMLYACIMYVCVFKYLLWTHWANWSRATCTMITVPVHQDASPTWSVSLDGKV